MNRFYSLAVGAVLASLAMAALPQPVEAVPVYVRQTGLSCNQCHVSPFRSPDFTWTGMKFRFNGWRAPWIADRIEAGEEGKLGGHRMSIATALPLNLHTRTILFQQSRSSYRPGDPKPDAGPISSDPFTTYALSITGPLNDYVAHWNEIYIQGAPGAFEGVPSTQGRVSINHWDIVAAFNPANNPRNVIGFNLRTHPSGNHNFFAAVPGGASNHMFNSNITQKVKSRYLQMSGYTLLADRVAIMLGVESGDDNWDWDRFGLVAQAGYFFFNSDDLWMQSNIWIRTGDDYTPAVSRYRLNTDHSLRLADRFSGISALREAAGGPDAPYASEHIGDVTRGLLSYQLGFADRGPHSANCEVSFGFTDETYEDGAQYKMRSVGGACLYNYDRTYGIVPGFQITPTQTFTDPTGTEYDLSSDLRLNVDFQWRMSMNMAWLLRVSQSQSVRLNERWNKGWSWQFMWSWAI